MKTYFWVEHFKQNGSVQQLIRLSNNVEWVPYFAIRAVKMRNSLRNKQPLSVEKNNWVKSKLALNSAIIQII